MKDCSEIVLETMIRSLFSNDCIAMTSSEQDHVWFRIQFPQPQIITA
jgi:hypothetical protein